MVKKKGKSKRVTLKDKYKVQRRVTETHRKRKKQVKRDAANGVVRHDSKKKKDPGIPNSWPFKQELLKDIQRAKERQQHLQNDGKERRKAELRALREHQEQGGTARTVEELLLMRASEDQAKFDAKNGAAEASGSKEKSDGTVGAGQTSRRAYLRELKKVVDTADVLLQVLDARDPMGSRIHPSIEEAILCRADKKMVLVLNKIDLVPKEVVGAWLTTLRRSNPAIAIKASLNLDRTCSSAVADDASTTSSSSVGMDGLLQLLKNYARTGGSGGKSKTTIVVGVIGYPNVGKSSIINALKRSRAVGVSPRPGFTTSMQEVVLDRNVRLLDSPGVMFDDQSAMLGNCLDPDSVEDPLPAVEALLKRCNHESLIMNYNIPSFPPGDTMMFLAMVARSYGRVLKGGIPDKVAAARTVLKDWNQGRIPYYTVPPREQQQQQEVSNDAVIVTQFGKEFDLSKFDEAVLGTLKDNDEMDFVKLEDRGKEAGAVSGPASKEALEFLSKDVGDEFMDDESASGGDDKRAEIANAEDFDFDEMM